MGVDVDGFAEVDITAVEEEEVHEHGAPWQGHALPDKRLQARVQRSSEAAASFCAA